MKEFILIDGLPCRPYPLHNVYAPGSYYLCEEVWFFNGEIHREDGPAVLTFLGYHYYFLHGRRSTFS